MNKYVDFVSDEDFIEEVRKVVDSYPDIDNEQSITSDILTSYKYGIDEFKVMFDLCVNQMELNNWLKFEKIRQDGKKVENKMGEFHQQLLGHVDGWIDLGIADDSHVDLKNENETIFIELKNKKNTTNYDSSKQVRNKLEDIAKNYENAVCYWAYIIQGGYKSEDKVWVKKGYKTNDRIRQISCDKVYELVTGDPHALEKTYDAVPKAISDIFGRDIEFSKKDQILLSEFKEHIFNNSE